MSDKTQKDSLLSMTAILASLWEGSLCLSVAHNFSKAGFSYVAMRTITAVWSCPPIKRSRERKMIDARVCIPHAYAEQ